MIQVNCPMSGCDSGPIEIEDKLQRFECPKGHKLYYRNKRVHVMANVLRGGLGEFLGFQRRVQLNVVNVEVPKESKQDKARELRNTATVKAIKELAPNYQPDEVGSFPEGYSEQIDKQTKRVGSGHGTVFKPVLVALKDVEKSPVEPNLSKLESAAQHYLDDVQKREDEGKIKGKPFKPDKVAQKKIDTCREAIEKVRKLRLYREIQEEFSKLPDPPRTKDEEMVVNRLRAKLIVESGGSSPLGEDDGKGASESFFLTDTKTKEKAFIFKPSDGEFVAGYGWEKGGGAPREVSVSAVNEVLREKVGLDCGVSPTTFISIDNPNVATKNNGGNPKRSGAIQSFVKADPELTAKLDPTRFEQYDKDFINEIPAEEIEKVAILDFVTLQMDRQESNLLVSRDEEGKPRLTPIDAGNALPSRKAFEASRRMFSNNALFKGDEGGKKFSEEALQKILAINENDVLDGMKKANEQMAVIDPSAGQAIGNENMEMTRRSIRFLKKAAAQLTKAEIADAYANLFQDVLDAAPEDVDAAIEKAIKTQLEKPAVTKQVDEFAGALEAFMELGWPKDEFLTMKRENPTRLLKILQQRRECPAALAEIDKIVSEVGAEQIGNDLLSTKSLGDRLSKVRNRKNELETSALLNDPEIAKAMKKSGWDFSVTDEENNTRKLVLADQQVTHIKRFQAYMAAGGDKALKERKLNVGKMTVAQKIYESLGGDVEIDRLDRLGYNPYKGSKIAIRISDLEAFKEFEALGGEEKYVQLGCPQNKEIDLPARVKLIKQKLLVFGDTDVKVGGATVMLEKLEKLFERIASTKEKCTNVENDLLKKRPLYTRFDQESAQPMEEEAKQQRLEQIDVEDLEVSAVMKNFGKWNRDIISPWKTLQGLIKTENLGNDKRIKQVNRQVTQAYDAYVAAFGAAQDLGQDYLDLLRRLRKRTKGEAPTPESTVEDIEKLNQQMTSSTFGAATKVHQQLLEVQKIQSLVNEVKDKTDEFGEEQWDEVADWDTKVRQAFEIAKANYRATLRGKDNLSDFVKPWPNEQSVSLAAAPVAEAIKKAGEEYASLEKIVETVLQMIFQMEHGQSPEGIVGEGVPQELQENPPQQNEIEEEVKEQIVDSEENSLEDKETEVEEIDVKEPTDTNEEFTKLCEILRKEVVSPEHFRDWVLGGKNSDRRSKLKIEEKDAKTFCDFWAEANQKLTSNINEDVERLVDRATTLALAISSEGRVTELFSDIVSAQLRKFDN